MIRIFLATISWLIITYPAHGDTFEATFLAGQGDFNVEGADFSSHAIYELRQTWVIKRNFALELGLNATSEAKDEGSDVKGQYESTLKTRHVFTGMKFTGHFADIHNAYVRLGMSYGETTIKIEESFSGLREGGSDEQSHNGQGYYWGLGFGSWIHHRIQLGIDGTQYLKYDVFNDQSDYPFDLTDAQLSVFATYAF